MEEERNKKEEDYGAFIHKFQLLPTDARRPLQGLTFAVKDM